MSNVAVHETVFEWRAPIAADLARKARLSQLGLFGAGGVMVALGIVSAVSDVAGDVRFLLVVGLMLLGLGILGAMDSRRLRSTVLRIDRMGMLSLTDSKGSASIDLRGVSVLAIRHRTGRPQWRWSIEAVQPAGGWHADLAGLATYWNLDQATITALDAELQRWLAWATGRSPGTGADAGPSAASEIGGPGSRFVGSSAAASTTPVDVPGATTNTDRIFEWQPLAHPNKARNRRRVRIGVGGLVLAIAVIAAVSEAENGLSAVLLSMFVPVLILLFGFGFDRVYDLSKRFRVRVDGAGLSIRRSSGKEVVIPASDIVSLSVSLVQHSSHDANVDSSSWFLQVQRVDGEWTKAQLPVFFGTSFARNDAIALEAELRRRLGLTT